MVLRLSKYGVKGEERLHIVKTSIFHENMIIFVSLFFTFSWIPCFKYMVNVPWEKELDHFESLPNYPFI